VCERRVETTAVPMSAQRLDEKGNREEPDDRHDKEVGDEEPVDRARAVLPTGAAGGRCVRTASLRVDGLLEGVVDEGVQADVPRLRSAGERSV